MCDYSLEHIQSREAKVGDKLVISAFPASITRGFIEAGSPALAQWENRTAVCLLPGTELVFKDTIKHDHHLGFYPPKDTSEKTAVFRQIHQGLKHEHHDALEFPNGRIVLLTRLLTGQEATVLQLPVIEKPVERTVRTLPDGIHSDPVIGTFGIAPVRQTEPAE